MQARLLTVQTLALTHCMTQLLNTCQMLQAPAAQSCHHNPLTQPTSEQLCESTRTSADLSQHDTARQSVHHYVDTGVHASCNIDADEGAASQQDATEAGVVGASEPASQLLCDTAMELWDAEASAPASPRHASRVCEPNNGTEAERALRELEDFCRSEPPDHHQDVLCIAATSAPLHSLWKTVRTLQDCPDALLPLQRTVQPCSCHSTEQWLIIKGNMQGVTLVIQDMEKAYLTVPTVHHLQQIKD